MAMQERWPTRFPPEKKITQAEAGAIIGKSQNAGWKWQNGKPAEPKHVRELAVKLNVCTEWLETGREPKRPGEFSDPVLANIVRMWPELSATVRAHIRGIVEAAEMMAGETTPSVWEDAPEQLHRGSDRSPA